jgi:hypothetical protein
LWQLAVVLEEMTGKARSPSSNNENDDTEDGNNNTEKNTTIK